MAGAPPAGAQYAPPPGAHYPPPGPYGQPVIQLSFAPPPGHYGPHAHAAATRVQAAYRGHAVRKTLRGASGFALDDPVRRKAEVRVVEGQGTLKLTLHRVRKLHDANCCCSMSPYVRLGIAGSEHVAETTTCKSAGTEPSWGRRPQTFCFKLSPGGKKVDVEVRTSGTFCDSTVAETSISVDTFLDRAARKAVIERIRLRRTDGNGRAGELHTALEYLPPLSVCVRKAADLWDAQLLGKQDPYVIVEFEPKKYLARGEPGTRQTKTHEDGHKTPKWAQTFHFALNHEGLAVLANWDASFKHRRYADDPLVVGEDPKKKKDDKKKDEEKKAAPPQQQQQPYGYPGQPYVVNPYYPYGHPPPGAHGQAPPEEVKAPEPPELTKEEQEEIDAMRLKVQVWNANIVRDSPIAYTVIPITELVKTRGQAKKPIYFKLRKGAIADGNKENAGKIMLYVP